MLFNDTYYQISEPSDGLFKDKGSKFLAHAYPVKNEEEIKGWLEFLRKKYFDARHHCYAWILNPDKSAYRINDDGEPSGSAGRPIYGQILRADLTNVLVVVIRYFGGTKLGIPGLINAYKTATKEALSVAEKTELFVKDVYRVDFQYADMNLVMKLLKDENLDNFDHDFGVDCYLKFSVRKTESNRIFDLFRSIHTIRIKYEKTI
jgi:uncharacterized YigZ family protein